MGGVPSFQKTRWLMQHSCPTDGVEATRETPVELSDSTYMRKSASADIVRLALNVAFGS